LKLLFISSRFPWPPDRGDRLTVYNMLGAMRGHSVTFACFVDGREPAAARERIAPRCERLVTVELPPSHSWLQAWMGLFTTRPSQVWYYESRRMRAALRGLIAHENFDAILIHAIRTAPLVLDAPHPLKVLFQGDAVGAVLARSIPYAPAWKRPGLHWERWRADRFLVECTRRVAATWVLSAPDRDYLTALGAERVEAIPHGVDESLFALEPTASGSPRVMFLGNLSVPHNIDAAEFAAREVWPEIHRAWPDGRLVLAGADPTPAVRGLGSIAGVEVTGFVPDLAPLWRQTHVMLAPLRFSAGIQNKVLEAMAAGVPVVTTRAVADGIEAKDGEHLLVGETASELVAAVARVVRDPESARARAARAREHVRAHFSWSTAVRRLESMVAARRR
jgi:sugar transferase (PEP-CTERM/EpsH1 system associated)